MIFFQFLFMLITILLLLKNKHEIHTWTNIKPENKTMDDRNIKMILILVYIFVY